MCSLALINTVCQYLLDRYMIVDEEWLKECIEHFSTNSNDSEEDIKKLVEGQWLLNDLKIVCPGSLPENLKSQQKTILNGKFVLQINSMIDVGTPAYQQYLKLKKVNMENIEATINAEEKISSHRMMMLQLTDGVQDISGIEYKPMRNLTCDIRPGFKILLKGPVECRRGLLLLTENSIELLGGEAQELFETNSLPAILHAKLAIEPETDYTIPSNPTITTPYPDIPPTVTDTSEITVEITHSSRYKPNTDDDIDINQLEELEAQLIDNPGKRTLNSNVSNPEKKLKIDTVDTIDDFNDVDYLDDADLFEDIDHLREIEAQNDARENALLTPLNTGPVRVSIEPFIYIKQFHEMSEVEKAGRVFKVKGQVMTLLSKLSVGKDEWSLKCTIVDGTGRLDVDFTSDVLSKLVGLTPHEVHEMRKRATALETTLKTALKNARDKLQVMYCIIEITMFDTPKITDYKPFDSNHVEQLKSRLPTGML